ncbi:hypothetical protein SAMN05192561_10260 [Halopenitus malekzadehii]|uniref:Uncharacterized protein n=1 Tax=Halopenitus malekzadehii TaxID=1267564 RepID=A0A1H6IFI5_9EURY|nr:hypothetical protein [Halopenitus malekzadehii]SEH45681.1 hypothetical protein SAMN05192561_10260 [Halopenitus malekzadehii]
MAATRPGPLIICLLLLVTCGTPLVSATPDQMQPVAATTSSENPVYAAAESSNETNNSTRHIGPELPESDEPRTVVLSQFEVEIGARLEASLEATSARQFDLAEAELRGNMTQLVKQYEYLAANSSSASVETAENLNLTVQQQRELVEAARNSRALYSQYQAARATGNDTEARRLARELLNQTATGNQTASELIEQYEQLDNTTAINATEELEQLTTAQTRLAQLEETVQNDTFVETNLTITSVSTHASPADPLQVHGQLQANETGISNQSIIVTLDGQSIRTETTADGNFTATYRPITTEPGVNTLTVEYRPDPVSAYEGAQNQTAVSINTSTPTVTTTVNRTRGQFNDIVTIHGQVTANETGLHTVPVETTIGTQSFTQTRTNRNGEFKHRIRLPDTLPPGTRTIEITVADATMAVEQTTVERPITITPTATQLTLTATQQNQSTISITGQLLTETGTELPNRLIDVSAADTQSQTVRTNDTGEFTTVIQVPRDETLLNLPNTDQQLSITASFTPTGLNLQNTSTTTTLEYSPPASPSLRRTAYGVGVVLLIGGTVVVWRRRETFAGITRTSGETTQSDETSAPQQLETTAISPTALLDRAQDHLDRNDTEAAIRLGYAALRWNYLDSYDLSSALTYWELYNSIHDDLDTSEAEILFTMTTAFEQAVYTDQDDLPADTELAALLESIETLLE